MTQISISVNQPSHLWGTEKRNKRGRGKKRKGEKEEGGEKRKGEEKGREKNQEVGRAKKERKREEECFFFPSPFIGILINKKY